MRSIFTVDVEDWFHILDLKSTPDMPEWDFLPSCVEQNFIKLLDIFSEKNVFVTCFFLGWVAEKFPHLVLEADRRGHEVASHGYQHKLVYKMTPDEFYDDAKKSKHIIEDILGKQVKGFRAPGFSNTQNTPWFFEKLMDIGYKYDSSLFPVPRLHGGMKSENLAPFVVDNEIIEFPITLLKLFNSHHCFFGGGYIRHNHYFVIKYMVKKVLNENRPVIFYIHPREIDPHHPRLPMNLIRNIKSYGFLHTTRKKLNQILDDFEITTFDDFINENSALFETDKNSNLIKLYKNAKLIHLYKESPLPVIKDKYVSK